MPYVNIKPWAQSSIDPTQISNRVRASALALGGLIIWAAAQGSVVITPTDIDAIAQQLGDITGLVAGAISALWYAYGLVMSLYMRFAKK